MWRFTGVTVGSGMFFFAVRWNYKKTLIAIKNETMPSSIRTASKVSSITSKKARLLEPPPGKKRRIRERLFGVVLGSVDGGQWEVLWDGGVVETMPPSNLKNESDPSEESMAMVENYHRNR